MSGDDEGQRPPGRRRDGQPFREGNVREDGSYEVGRNRPPAEHRFRKGDGRKRGRRAKGVCNADTLFEKELARKVPVNENGRQRMVSKSLAVDLRLIDNAAGKGENKAIEMVDARRRRIAERRENNRLIHPLGDQEIIDRYLLQRAAELAIDPDLFGDPVPVDNHDGDQREPGDD